MFMLGVIQELRRLFSVLVYLEGSFTEGETLFRGNDGSYAGEDPIRKAKDSPLEWSESLQPQIPCWALSNSHSKRDSVSSMTMDPQGCRNEQNHLPCADSQCPKCPNTSTKHLKTICRCLPSQKDIGSFSCLNEEGVRGTEEIRPSSAHHAVANGTGGELPWYLTVIHEKLTAQLKEEVSQKGQEAAGVTGELRRLQTDLAKERAAQAQLERQAQANQDIITALHLQHNRAKVSLEQVQTRFERLRVKIIQAAYSAPGAKQPQAEITDAALLQTMQKIIDDRTAFHQRLQQKGEKMAPLTTAEKHSVKTTPASDKN